MANCDSRIAARFLHIRQRKQLPLTRDHPALQGITRSTYPAGFPLDDRLHQASDKEVGTLTTPTIPDTQQNRSTSRLSQPIQEGAPQFTVPGVTVARVSPTKPTYPNSTPTSAKSNGIPLHPVPAVSLVGLGGENPSIPQFFLVNQPGSRSYTPALAGASELTQLLLHVPTHPVDSVPQSLDVDSVPNAGLPVWSTDRKPFTLRKHSRNVLKNADKSMGKRC